MHHARSVPHNNQQVIISRIPVVKVSQLTSLVNLGGYDTGRLHALGCWVVSEDDEDDEQVAVAVCWNQVNELLHTIHTQGNKKEWRFFYSFFPKKKEENNSKSITNSTVKEKKRTKASISKTAPANVTMMTDCRLTIVEPVGGSEAAAGGSCILTCTRLGEAWMCGA